VLSATVVMLMLLCGLGASGASNVTLYTSVPQPIVDAIIIAFEAANPGLKLQAYRASTSNVLAKLMAEHEGGRVTADVIWVADAAVYENLKDQGILQRYESTHAKLIPAVYKDADLYYYHARLTNVVIGYNTRFIKGDLIPTSWHDLANPKFRNKIGLSTPERSGAFLVAASALVNHPEFGWSFFEKTHANGAVYDSNNGVLQKVATGELLLGVVLDFQVREMKEQGSPVDYVWPKEGAVLAPSPVAILAKGPNQAGARTLVDFLLSKEGQSKLAELSVIPVRADVPAPQGVSSLQDAVHMKVDWAWTAANQATLIQRFNALTQ